MSESQPIRHRVVVPIDGWTVADALERVKALGIDPASREARLVSLEAPQPDWEAAVTFEVGAQGAVPTGVEVRSTQGKRLTRAVWDRVRVGEVLGEAAAVARWLAPVTRADVTPFETEPQHRGRGMGRPSVYSDAHYRRVADVYRAALAAGRPPVRAVAQAFAGGAPGLTDSRDARARAWARAARARGYLGEEQA